MKNKEQHISMSFEMALKDPSMAHFHEAIVLLQSKPNKDLLPKKYEKSMTNLAVSDTVKLFRRNPNMPLKMVVSTIIQSFPDDVSPQIIVKMTKKIVEKWLVLSASLHQGKPTVLVA